jgi:hypothetical protein
MRFHVSVMFVYVPHFYVRPNVSMRLEYPYSSVFAEKLPGGTEVDIALTISCKNSTSPSREVARSSPSKRADDPLRS